MTNEQLYKSLLKAISTTHNTDWVNWIVPIVVALIGFIGVIVSANIARGNLTRQFNNELEKVKAEYKYNQKRDDRNFANRLVLNKLSELYAEINLWYREDYFVVIKVPSIELTGYDADNSKKPDVAIAYQKSMDDHYVTHAQNVRNLLAFYPDAEKNFNKLQNKAILCEEAYDDAIEKWSNDELDQETVDKCLSLVSDCTNLHGVLTRDVLNEIAKMIKKMQK